MTATLNAATGAVAESSAPTRYHRLKVGASFAFSVDHGNHPRSSWNGTYTKGIGYELRAIVAYDGSRVAIPAGNAIIDGQVLVDDDRTKLDPRTGARVRLCRKPNKTLNTGKALNGVFIQAPAAKLALSGGRLSVDPGTFLANYSGCGDGDLYHGLQSGFRFSVSAPKATRFAGTERFLIYCNDDYSHAFTPRADQLHSHAFDGYTKFFVQFTPVPADQLKVTKDWLRNTVGKPGTFFPPGKPKECL